MTNYFHGAVPPINIGGYNIGAAGAVKTIYENHILSWADDFTDPLDFVGPSTPKGKYFATKGYSAGPRGNATNLGVSYDTDPLWTGYLDSNRGTACGFTNVSQSSSLLTLGARLATVGEQANLPFTSPTLNGGVRATISSMIHSEGIVGFYPASNASVIVEANLKYVGNGQSGWHPDFWVNSGNPMHTYGPGSFDSLNACEGNSTAGDSSTIRIVNGVQTGVGNSPFFSDLYDGNFHTISMVLMNGGSWYVYIDGVLKETLSAQSNVEAKPQYFLLTSHVYNATWNSETYSQAAWNSTGAGIIVDWVRVWRPNTANHYVPLATIPDLQVDYNGSGTIVLPSVSSLWGNTSVTEYVQTVPTEANSPGMDIQTIYNQFPPGVSYNSGTRTITVNFSGVQGSAGVLHGVAKAWTADGSTFQPARFTITRGPRMISSGGNITVGSPSSVDLYAASDVGIATPKTISVSGLPLGMSFNPSTGLVTGTPSGTAVASTTVTNSLGQNITANFNFGTLQNETYFVIQRMQNAGGSPTTTTQNAIDACISSLKANGLWPNILAMAWFENTDQASALINWKGDYFNPLLTGTPTFSNSYRGFTTDGSSNGVDTNCNASLYAIQNQVAFSVWSNTAGQTANSGCGAFDGTASLGITLGLRNTSDQFSYRVNDGTSATISNTDGSGLFTALRSGATTKKAYRNGSQIGTTLSTASTGQANFTFALGYTNSQTLTYSARQWGGYVVRYGSLTDTDEANLYSALNTLHGAVGP